MTVRLMKPMRFQLTASRRGWPSLKHKCRKSMSISTHSLTKRLTMHSKLTRLNQFYFNSQPHEEADNLINTCVLVKTHFNSQPHEEADFYWLWKRNHPDISTHSLTKRLTTTMPTKTNYHIGISTHSLTKRLTNIKDNFFHCSEFQLTASRRGWLPPPLFWCPFSSISTHSLTKRLTVPLGISLSDSKNFNSQPHEEADLTIILTSDCCNYFNSQPHEEADIFTITIWKCYCHFNSQTHEEADQLIQIQ